MEEHPTSAGMHLLLALMGWLDFWDMKYAWHSLTVISQLKTRKKIKFIHLIYFRITFKKNISSFSRQGWMQIQTDLCEYSWITSSFPAKFPQINQIFWLTLQLCHLPYLSIFSSCFGVVYLLWSILQTSKV